MQRDITPLPQSVKSGIIARDPNRANGQYTPKYILDDMRAGKRRHVEGVIENGKSAVRGSRKAAAAVVAKIPLPLSRFIGSTYRKAA